LEAELTAAAALAAALEAELAAAAALAAELAVLP
jgi:hypothetical protein